MTPIPTFARNPHPMRHAMPLLPMDAEQARFWELRRKRHPTASPASTGDTTSAQVVEAGLGANRESRS